MWVGHTRQYHINIRCSNFLPLRTSTLLAIAIIIKHAGTMPTQTAVILLQLLCPASSLSWLCRNSAEQQVGQMHSSGGRKDHRPRDQVEKKGGINKGWAKENWGGGGRGEGREEGEGGGGGGGEILHVCRNKIFSYPSSLFQISRPMSFLVSYHVCSPQMHTILRVQC